MADPLLALLDRGAVRDALALAAGDGVSARIVAAWGSAGTGDPAAAVAALRPLVAALEAPAAAGDGDARTQHAHAVLALGVASVLRGDGDAGVALLERALTLHTEAWPRAQAQRFAALALEQRGAWEGAAARYMAAAATYREIGHEHGGGSALYGAATALAEAGDETRARPLLDDAVRLLRSCGATPALAAALGLLAALVVEHDGPAALALLDEADLHGRDVPGMYGWDVRMRRGEVLLHLGRAEDALVPLREAREMIPAGIPEAVWVDNLIARALVRLGRYDAVDTLLRASVDERRGPAAGLSGAALLERTGLSLVGLARAVPLDVVATDTALDVAERAVRARWHRRGVDQLLVDAAALLAAPAGGPEAEEAARRDRAARALQLAVALGATPAEASIRALRVAGARIPLGPLWLEARIGRGGMGDVWRASHRNGGEVAVKILRGDQGDQHAALFDAEMQAVARLDHPHVVRVLAALRLDAVAAAMLGSEGEGAVEPGGRALVMELVHGGSLEERLTGWRWPEARALLGALLEALAHAHARGVLHLDLKPANVLVDEVRGVRVPRLTDFGLAGLARADREARLLGTPAYMAPEQATLGAALGPATDLYALGCLAWRLFAGRVPFLGDRVADTLALHRSAPLPRFAPMSAVPRGLEEWLRGLLAKRPEHRFACAADAAWALDQLGEPALAGRGGAASAGPAGDTFDPESGPVAAARRAPRAEAAPPGDTVFPGAFDTGGGGHSGGGHSGGGHSGGGGHTGGGLRAAAPSDGDEPRAATLPVPRPRPLSDVERAALTLSLAESGAPAVAAAAPDAGLRAPAPFLADWRAIVRAEAPPLLWGAGEGLFSWRVGRLVGREAERDRLWAALGAVHADGGGRAVWITGAEGLGRSALLAWLAETAQVAGAAWVAPATPADTPPPADRPRLVLLDDPDPATAERALSREAESATLVVVASRAPAPPGADPLVLAPLSAADLHALLDERIPIDRALATSLAARAAGSPAFALALLTDLVRRDALEPGPEGFRVRPDIEIPLPDDVRSLWSARLDALAPPGSPRRSAWEIAALFGVRVPLHPCAEACARAGLLPDPAAFGPLEAEGWVAQSADGVVFRVPAIMEALRAGAAASGRDVTWHALLADVLPEDARGRHLAAAGRHAEALRPLRRAASNAVNGTRLQEGRELLELWDRSADALGLAPDDPLRASPIVVRVHLALHTHEDPYPLLDAGLRIATGDFAAQLTYTLAWVLAQDNRHAEADPAYVRALALTDDLGFGELCHVCTLGLAGSRYALGIDADPLVDALRPAIADRADLLVRLDACAGRGQVRLGRLDRAETLLTRAVAGARRIGAPDVEADALVDLAEASAAAGDTAGEVRCLHEAVTALAGAGSNKALRVRVRLAAALVCAGRESEARAVLATARRFGWRLRPADAAELVLVGRVVEGGDIEGAVAAVPRSAWVGRLVGGRG